MATSATSLAAAYTLRDVATRLALARHADLVCINIMCERTGQACACRLALTLSRMPALEVIDISNNRLPQLPDDVFTRPLLVELNASGNLLTALPGSLERAQRLVKLDLRGNAFTALPMVQLARLPALRELGISGNPGESAIAAEAAAALPHVQLL